MKFEICMFHSEFFSGVVVMLISTKRKHCAIFTFACRMIETKTVNTLGNIVYSHIQDKIANQTSTQKGCRRAIDLVSGRGNTKLLSRSKNYTTPKFCSTIQLKYLSCDLVKTYFQHVILERRQQRPRKVIDLYLTTPLVSKLKHVI